MMTRQENWTMFLYFLIRDDVPVGTVTRIVREIEAIATKDVKYTNNALQAVAQDFMQRIDAL